MKTNAMKNGGDPRRSRRIRELRYLTAHLEGYMVEWRAARGKRPDPSGPSNKRQGKGSAIIIFSMVVIGCGH